jgi:hypothetical protein
MIKIKEEGEGEGENKNKNKKTAYIGKVHVTLENNEEKVFENYPIIIKSKDVKHSTYKIQKSTKTKTHSIEKGGIMDKVIEKAKDVKDKVMDTAKDVTEKTKDTVNKTTTINQKGTSEENSPDTENGRMDDPLISRK